MDTTNHIKYINFFSPKLKKLPKLSVEDIRNIRTFNYKEDIITKIILYGYYGYFSYLDNYKIEEFSICCKNYPPIYCLAAFYGKLKFMKYLENRGFNININKYEENNPYFYATQSDNIKVLKHLEQFNFPKINSWKLKIYKFALIYCNKVKTLKYLESVGVKPEYSIGIINKKKNIKKLEYFYSLGYKIANPIIYALMEGNIKLIKYLYKKSNRNYINCSFSHLRYYYMGRIIIGRFDELNIKLKKKYDKKRNQLKKIISLINTNNINNFRILFI